jgi:hypothetical protein
MGPMSSGLPANRGDSRRAPLVVSVLRLVLLAGVVLAGLAFGAVWSWGAALEVELGAGYRALLGALVASAVLALVALVRGGKGALGLCLRAAFSLTVLVECLLVFSFPSYREPYVLASFGLAAGVLAVRALATPSNPAALARPVRILDLVAFGTALGVLAAELGLRLAAALFHPSILAESSDVAEWADAHRMQPGLVRFGFPVNSRGFYDGDACPAEGARGRDRRLLQPGDGRALAAPHERRRGRAPRRRVHNVGVAGADPETTTSTCSEEVCRSRRTRS